MCLWRFQSGVIAQSHEGFTTKFAGTGFEVHGTEGSLVAKDVMTQKPIGSVMLRTEAGEEELSFDRDDLYTRSLRAFHAAVRGEGQPLRPARTASGRWRRPKRRCNPPRPARRSRSSRARERDVSKTSPPPKAALIKDGMTVSVSSSCGLGCPDLVLQAIGERFDAEGHPREPDDAAPDRRRRHVGIKGIDHLAKSGLLKNTLCGSYPSGPSSAEPPLIWQMIGDNSVAAYNIPSGILFDMHREAAAKRPGVLTKVGLDTFVDPRHEGCAMNDGAPREPVVASSSSRARNGSISRRSCRCRDHSRHDRR